MKIIIVVVVGSVIQFFTLSLKTLISYAILSTYEKQESNLLFYQMLTQNLYFGQ